MKTCAKLHLLFVLELSFWKKYPWIILILKAAPHMVSRAEGGVRELWISLLWNNVSKVRQLIRSVVKTRIQSSLFSAKSLHYPTLFSHTTHFLFRDERKTSCLSLYIQNMGKRQEHLGNLEFKVLSLVLVWNLHLPPKFLLTILRERINPDFESSEENGFLNLNGWTENKAFVLIIFSHRSPGTSPVSRSQKKEVWVYASPLFFWLQNSFNHNSYNYHLLIIC